MPVGHVDLKMYMPCKNFHVPSQYNIYTNPVKLMYTDGKISTCPDWKISCPVGHITRTVNVSWGKINMPRASGHALMSSPGISTSSRQNLTILKTSRHTNPVSECYCLHLVPKFGGVHERQNWWLHPTVVWPRTPKRAWSEGLWGRGGISVRRYFRDFFCLCVNFMHLVRHRMKSISNRTLGASMNLWCIDLPKN